MKITNKGLLGKYTLQQIMLDEPDTIIDLWDKEGNLKQITLCFDEFGIILIPKEIIIDKTKRR